MISTANGLKFTQFKIRYHDSEIADVESSNPNIPVELPNDVEAVKKAVLGRFS